MTQKRFGMRRLLVFGFGLLLVFSLAAVLLVFVAAAFGPSGLAWLSAVARNGRPWMALLWAGVIWLVCRYYWEQLVAWLCRHGLVEPHSREAVLGARWRVATLLLLIDAVLIAGLPFSLFA